MEPRYNEGPRDWKNLFAMMTFPYVQVLFHIFYYYWGKEKSLLYRGLLLYRGSLYRGSTVRVHRTGRSAVVKHKIEGKAATGMKWYCGRLNPRVISLVG